MKSKKVLFPFFLKVLIVLMSLTFVVGVYLSLYSSDKIKDQILAKESFYHLVQTKLITENLNQLVQGYRNSIAQTAKTNTNTQKSLVALYVLPMNENSTYSKSTLYPSSVTEEDSQILSPFHNATSNEQIEIVRSAKNSFLKMSGKIDPDTHFVSYYSLNEIKNILSKNDLSNIDLIDSSGMSLNKKIVLPKAIKENAAKQTSSFQIQDKDIYYSVVKTHFGISVVSSLASSEINPIISFLKNQIYFILGIVLSLSFLISFILSEKITQPITSLVNATKRIKSGDFDNSDLEKINTHDEFTTLSKSFIEMTIGLKEREKYLNVLNKFHGQEITHEIISNPHITNAKKSKMTVLFTDLRNFTSLSENMEPEETVLFLNDYFASMIKIIKTNGGIIDKFIGDAIMAVWGAPYPSEEDAQNAVKACLEMRETLKEINQKRALTGLAPIEMGMGLHTGEAVSGVIGSDERLEYTVIGDTVNTASRIESATKEFKTDILMSEATQKEIKLFHPTQFLGDVSLKGKQEKVSLLLYHVQKLILGSLSFIVIVLMYFYVHSGDSSSLACP